MPVSVFAVEVALVAADLDAVAVAAGADGAAAATLLADDVEVDVDNDELAVVPLRPWPRPWLLLPPWSLGPLALPLLLPLLPLPLPSPPPWLLRPLRGAVRACVGRADAAVARVALAAEGEYWRSAGASSSPPHPARCRAATARCRRAAGRGAAGVWPTAEEGRGRPPCASATAIAAGLRTLAL